MARRLMARARAASAPSHERAERSQLRRFRRTSAVTLVVLALAAAGLGTAAVLRGPTLQAGSVNPAATITRPDQKLVLHADQPLEAVDASQVTVTPAAPFTLDSSGADVTLTFGAVLDYATDYAVRVDGVTGDGTGLTGTIDYSFRTPDIDVYSLLRRGGAAAGADKPDDQILRSSLASGADSSTDVVLEAPRIQQYAVAGDALAVILLDAEGGSTLAVAQAGATPATVFTPTGSRIQNLHASATAGLFGYTVNGGQDAQGRVYQNALFTFDPLDASGRPKEVTGFDGSPLRVVDWQFVPGSSALVAQSTDQQLYLIEPLGSGGPTPLGRHVEMRDFLAGGLKLVVADPAGTSTIDLADGTVEPLDQAVPDADPALYPGAIATLPNGATVRQYDAVDYSSGSAAQSSVILYADAAGTGELYRPAAAGSRIRSFCLSPNGQYLAVETIAGGAVGDGYALPGYSEMTTYFVEVTSGAVERGVPGFQPDWCG
ncbi:hypothetical protein [Herbiconiux flava]|uniref:SbsA Ig-like domain-containing protein n=1 Tax=Herbiconiux flava TaxID=881268 RepID=A0A852SSM6_9MICO|nr:hypothetical protein [Herbiconiux flava]NYD71773.1 hypothetical protein [Herbiconiux flava]GLK18263.1 hypothetical protein GCM10017602_27450 [Herbiconiux flava]